jgi:hypothetical protein
MTLHAPTHPAGYASHHYLRNALVVVGAIALAVVLWGAALIIQPTIGTPSETVSQQQLFNDFRAGERASWAASGTDQQQLYNDFRAGERQSWGSP